MNIPDEMNIVRKSGNKKQKVHGKHSIAYIWETGSGLFYHTATTMPNLVVWDTYIFTMPVRVILFVLNRPLHMLGFGGLKINAEFYTLRRAVHLCLMLSDVGMLGHIYQLLLLTAGMLPCFLHCHQLFFFGLTESGWQVERAEGERDICRAPLNRLFESLLSCFRVSATAASWLEFMLVSCTLFQQSLQNSKWCFSPCCRNNSACLCILLFRHAFSHILI